MNKKYLPIGSIVTLLGESKKIMIVGYYSIKYDNGIKICDYMGCLYPEGLLDISNFCSFNHGDIANVIFEGYKDENFDIISNNLTKQLLTENNDNYMSNVNMANIDNTNNSVMLYDEVGLKKETKINEMMNSIGKSIEIIDENSQDLEIPGITNQEDIYNKPMYQFNENDFVIFDNNESLDISSNNDSDVVSIKAAGTDSSESVKDDFVVPHYQFDENGIIIEN